MNSCCAVQRGGFEKLFLGSKGLARKLGVPNLSAVDAQDLAWLSYTGIR